MIDKIKQWVKVHYYLNQDFEISLIRSYTNDVYLIQSHDEKFVLKVYGKNWHRENEILWEMDLLNHLGDKGVKEGYRSSSLSGYSLVGLGI